MTCISVNKVTQSQVRYLPANTPQPNLLPTYETPYPPSQPQLPTGSGCRCHAKNY
ncbi:hypothetical protein B0H67DRAFT_583271 [Lasiosphaeris hirsuta]|uniref:Uncharacterized protein n=1 Tax=Lasiosphaeris hirsuta TaxID=260670 RepID=A0AA40A7K9_9PEZI|nr:hypothetical protein B0H67DRAFT_583271 [Lasiosphaeris hirsuta]